MNTRILSFASAFALTIGLFTGCSNTPVDSSSTENLDEYAAYKVVESDLTTYSEVPTFDESMSVSFVPKQNPDHEYARLDRQEIRFILKQLNLSEEQKAQIKICFTDHRTVAQAAKTTYHDARQGLNQTLRTNLVSLRDQVKAGTITKDAALPQFQTLVSDYKAAVAPLNETLKASLTDARSSLNACVSAVLTPDQLAKWNQLKGI